MANESATGCLWLSRTEFHNLIIAFKKVEFFISSVFTLDMGDNRKTTTLQTDQREQLMRTTFDCCRFVLASR